jgi:hypothetical protein
MRFSQSEMFQVMNEVSPTQVYEYVKDKLGFLRNWTGNIDDHKSMIEKAFGMYYNAGLPDRDLVSEKIAKKDYSGAANLMLGYAGGGNVDFHDFNQARGYKSKGYDMMEAREQKLIDKTSLIRYATEQGKRVFGNALSYEKVESMVRHAVDLTREQRGDTSCALGILKRFLTPVAESTQESSLDELIDTEIAPEFGLESVEEFEDVDFDDLEEAAKGKGSAVTILKKAVKSAQKKYGVDEPEAKSMIFGRLRNLRRKPKGKRKAKKESDPAFSNRAPKYREQVREGWNDKSASSGGAAAGSFPHAPTISKENPIDKRHDYLPKKNKDKDMMAGEDEGDEDTFAESVDELIDTEIAPEFGLDSVNEFDEIDFDDLEEAAKGKGSAVAILKKAVKKAQKDYSVDEPEAKSMIFGRLRKLRKKPKGKRKAKKDEQVIEGWNDKSASAGGAASGSFPHEPTKSGKNPIDRRDDYVPADKLFFKDIGKDVQEEIAKFASGKVDKKTLESFLNSEMSYEKFTQLIEDDDVIEGLDDMVYPIDEGSVDLGKIEKQVKKMVKDLYSGTGDDDATELPSMTKEVMKYVKKAKGDLYRAANFADDEGDDSYSDILLRLAKKDEQSIDEDITFNWRSKTVGNFATSSDIDNAIDEIGNNDKLGKSFCFTLLDKYMPDSYQRAVLAVKNALKIKKVDLDSYLMEYVDGIGESLEDWSDGDDDVICIGLISACQQILDGPSLDKVKDILTPLAKKLFKKHEKDFVKTADMEGGVKVSKRKKNEQSIDEGSAGIQRYGVDSGEKVNYEGESLIVMAFQYTDPTKGNFLGMGDGAYPSDYDVPLGSWIAYVYTNTDKVYVWAWGDDQKQAVAELLDIF